MTIFTRTAAALVALTLALPASAGPVAEAEAQLRDAYGAYRAALFLSNSGKAPETAAALAKFTAAWGGIASQWGANPPPQYADDAALGATFEKVSALAAKAGEQVAAGHLPEAHETLEGVRAEIGGLHERAGLIGFSDRMNAYHAAMEGVLTRDYAALGAGAVEALAGDAAVLDYLAGQIAAYPAPEAAQPEYAPLAEGFVQSVKAFKEAADRGDTEAALKARAGLKVPYSKLFAKFG